MAQRKAKFSKLWLDYIMVQREGGSRKGREGKGREGKGKEGKGREGSTCNKDPLGKWFALRSTKTQILGYLPTNVNCQQPTNRR